MLSEISDVSSFSYTEDGNEETVFEAIGVLSSSSEFATSKTDAPLSFPKDELEPRNFATDTKVNIDQLLALRNFTSKDIEDFKTHQALIPSNAFKTIMEERYKGGYTSSLIRDKGLDIAQRPFSTRKWTSVNQSWHNDLLLNHFRQG